MSLRSEVQCKPFCDGILFHFNSTLIKIKLYEINWRRAGVLRITSIICLKNLSIIFLIINYHLEYSHCTVSRVTHDTHLSNVILIKRCTAVYTLVRVACPHVFSHILGITISPFPWFILQIPIYMGSFARYFFSPKKKNVGLQNRITSSQYSTSACGYIV